MSHTIESMNAQIAKISELRIKEEQAGRVKKEVMDELALAEGVMLEMLVEEGMTSYAGPNGRVGITHRTSVKTPKSPASRELFFAYLKEKGLFDSMISVNSNTLNSLYKSELELSTSRGEPDFSIPGIDEVTLNQILTFKRS